MQHTNNLQDSIEWYAAQETDAVLKHASTAPDGLTNQEAEKRLKLHGKNVLVREKKIHPLVLFLYTFRNPLVLILLCVSIISFVLGETINATMVGVMVLMSVTLNFFQEFKANRAAQKLQEKVASRSMVIRDGKKEEIRSENICPGDILELNAGDLIPADARILSAKDFFVNQSSLTGESFPVEKFVAKIINKDPDLSDLQNMVFSGTSVLTGTATAVVVKTAHHTQFGKISQSLAKPQDKDEFTQGVNNFSMLILRVVLFFVIFIFFVNALLKHDILEAFAFSIAVAVGLTPEFLPMIMSVTMGKGSVRMAKKGVIVKKLSAIPSFGSMDVLCTDKTGTLTEAHIELIQYIDLAGNHSDNVLLHAYLNSAYQTGISNPMDDAVLAYKKLDISKYQKIDEIPFDFARKKMSVVVEHGNKYLMITKGAPEEIFRSCTSYIHENKTITVSAETKKTFLALYEKLSREGYRVLAVAKKELMLKTHKYSKQEEENLSLLGLTAFLDPAKKGAKEAINALESMGITMKVITGDSELVTEKICKDVGIKVEGILLGHELHHLTPEALQRRVENTTIFARFSPEEKHRIIKALKTNGHVVGYLGDGINDAPSLQRADVGISVSGAVDVAKEAAAIILTHKSLHELRDGVVEGRKTFGNTMKYILMGLSSNFGNMFSVLGAVIFLPFLPMLPIQILLNNFLYDISQLTIPMDNVDEEFIKTPRRWDIGYIRNFMFIFGPISSLFDFITYGLMYLLYHANPSGFQTGWFLESLATQTLVIHIIRTNKVPFFKSRASTYLWVTTIVAVCIGWVIPISPLGKFFGFSPMPLHVLIILGVIVLCYLLFAEVGKSIFYSHYYQKAKH
jgi:P-type Mg2+ transporter